MNLIYTVGGRGSWEEGSFYLGFAGTEGKEPERVDVFGLDGVLGWVGKEEREEK